MINECDSDQVEELLERIENNFGVNSILSLSTDKGFSSKSNNAYHRYAGVGVLAFNLHKIGNFLIKEELKINKAA